GASLNITVRATSADTSTADETFSIAITDVNEFAVSTPVDTNGAANTVAENAATGTQVGRAARRGGGDATDDTVSYNLTDNDGGKFAINSSSGVVAVAGAVDRDADGASLNITVRATSADTSTADETFSIAITDVNEFAVSTPVDNNGAANSVAENAATGTLSGIAEAANEGNWTARMAGSDTNNKAAA